MAITFIGLNGVDNEWDGQGNRVYRVVYKSTSNAAPTVDTEVDVSSAVAAHLNVSIGSAYAEDDGALLKSIKSRCVTRRNKASAVWEWSTELLYSSRFDDGYPDGPTGEHDPALRPAKVSMHVQTYEFPTMADRNGNPITNAAGDPVIRMKKRSRLLARYSRVVVQWDWRWLTEAREGSIGYMRSTNQSIWRPGGNFLALFGDESVGVECARIEDMKAEAVPESGGRVRVDIDVLIDPEGFEDRFFQQGFFALQTANDLSTRRRITDQGGFVTQPQLLRADGTHRRPDQPFFEPVVQSVKHYFPREWNEPPLGSPGYFSG